MIIKVCGMREADNIRAVEALGVDMMGFIFWPGSSRCVRQRPDYLPQKVKRVGVFVDETAENIKRRFDEFELNCIQLHGHESPEYCAQLAPYLLIKAFRISCADDLLQTAAYEGLVPLFLFDTKGEKVGGNGEKFDWDVLSAYHGTTPFLLSGGIGPEDAERVKAFSHPRCVGIDLNSCFEVAPALKDTQKLSTFINAIRL